MNITELFKIHVARSSGFENYDKGNVAFVTNGFSNNGIQGFVTPSPKDKVFHFKGICISAFCEASVQEPPFIGRGNGGSGLIVLEPKRGMRDEEMLLYAAYFNRYMRWKFSYGRMVTKERISHIDIPGMEVEDTPKVSSFLPKPYKSHPQALRLRYGLIRLSDIFKLHSGDYHNASALSEGEIPLISCGDKSDGFVKFVDVPEDKIYSNTLTIAYNGQPLTAKYHPYRFAAKDDVAVCIPKGRLRVTSMLFIQFVLNSERWRFSYGRKCFHEKLCKMSIYLPIKEDNSLDETTANAIVENTTYWKFLSQRFSEGFKLRHDIMM